MGYTKLPFNEESFIGRGMVALDIWEDGAPSGGEIHMGNNTQVVIEKTDDEVATLNDYTDVVTLPLAETQKALGYAIKITNTEYSRKVLAMQLFGTVTDFSQVAGSVDVGTPEDVVAKLDLWVKLDHRNIDDDPALVLKDVTDATTYVEGTHYELDRWTGRVKVLSGGTIVDGATLHASYSYLGLSGFKVSGMKKTQFDATLRFTGIDMQHQTRSVELIAYKIRIKPTKGLDLITDEHASNEFEGKIFNTDDGYFDFYVFEE